MIRHLMNWHRVLLALPVLFTILAGCSSKSSSTTLRFPKISVDLGVVDGSKSVIHEFPFEVSEKSGIRIEKVQSTCKCTAVSSAEVGRQLAFGDKGSIRVAIEPQERSGKMQGTVYVETSPPSVLPIILNLTAIVPGKPEVVGPFPVKVSAVLGNTVQIDFDVATNRPLGDKPLQIDLAQSEMCGFTIDREELIEATLPPEGALEESVHEIHRLRLKHVPFTELGSRVEKLQIAWLGCSARTSAQLSITVSHPFEVRPASTFLGFVKSNEKKSVWLTFTEPISTKASTLMIEPLEGGDDQATYDAGSNRIHVELTSPVNAGRFVKTWALRSADSTLPPFSFSISGLVE